MVPLQKLKIISCSNARKRIPTPTYGQPSDHHYGVTINHSTLELACVAAQLTEKQSYARGTYPFNNSFIQHLEGCSVAKVCASMYLLQVRQGLEAHSAQQWARSPGLAVPSQQQQQLRCCPRSPCLWRTVLSACRTCRVAKVVMAWMGCKNSECLADVYQTIIWLFRGRAIIYLAMFL